MNNAIRFGIISFLVMSTFLNFIYPLKYKPLSRNGILGTSFLFAVAVSLLVFMTF
jgi:hypothetical protein